MLEYDKDVYIKPTRSVQSQNKLTELQHIVWLIQTGGKESFFKSHTDMVDQQRVILASV